jgi:multidrug efflux system membrane fusion protein
MRTVCTVACIALAMLAGCSAPPPPATESVVPVSVAVATKKAVPDLVSAIGTVEAINSVAVKSLVDGQLMECAVKDGEDIEAGQLLFRIDPRPAQAALAQAQAALAKDVSARELARAQVERYKPVADKGFISADQMQQYVTAFDAAAASVKVDQANVDAAKLTLGYTDIHAPIAGRAGRVLVQPGNLVKANDASPLLVINQIAPIYVGFSIPGKLVDRVRQAQALASLAVQARADGLASPQDGELAFVDNAVDAATGTVKLRARFANAGEQLWPGQFVNVTLNFGNEDGIIVPGAAVKAGPDGSYVFVVKPDGRAEQRGVEVARSIDGEAVVSKGLRAGENVVTDGQSRLADGTRVKVVASGQQEERKD